MYRHCALLPVQKASIVLASTILFSCGEKKLAEQKSPQTSTEPKTPPAVQSTEQKNVFDPFWTDIDVLIRYGNLIQALEIITEKLRENPADEKLLNTRTLIFLKAGQPELAALSNDEHARATSKNLANGLIRALLHEEESVRTNAIQALDIAEDPRRFEAVMPLAATDKSPLVRVAALRLLRKSEDNQLKTTFLVLSRDESWIVRAEAVESLERWNDPDVRAAVWRATDDEESIVRHRARAVITKLFASEHAEEYRRMASGHNSQMALAAALVLANNGDCHAAPVLTEAFITSRDIPTRREAARALGHLGKISCEHSAQILEALHNALGDTDTSLLSAVLDALESIADTSSIDPLSRFATNPLVPAVLSRRAFELLRILRANLTKQDIPTDFAETSENPISNEQIELPRENEHEP